MKRIKFSITDVLQISRTAVERDKDDRALDKMLIGAPRISSHIIWSLLMKAMSTNFRFGEHMGECYEAFEHGRSILLRDKSEHDTYTLV